MATVQLVGVESGKATVQRDDLDPVVITWGELHAAKQQDGPAGYVYRWLMREFCRCEYARRQGRPWSSPRREVSDIVSQLREQDTREAAAAESARRERLARLEEEERQEAREREIQLVEAERQRTAADDPWWPIPSWEIPQGVRFDVPRRNQGQIVEVSYGTFGRYEADDGDPYMHVLDRSDRSSMTYRRREV